MARDSDTKTYEIFKSEEDVETHFNTKPVSPVIQHSCPSCGGQCRCDVPHEYCPALRLSH